MFEGSSTLFTFHDMSEAESWIMSVKYIFNCDLGRCRCGGHLKVASLSVT